MLEVELQKLTAAIEALTVELRSAKVGNQLPTETSTNSDSRSQPLEDAQTIPTNSDKPRQKREKPKVTTVEVEALVEAVAEEIPKSPEPEIIAANIGEADLKTMAMEIVRADSSARPIILSILAEHGAKTITQLDTKHYRAVHGRLLSLAFDIAKAGEPI